MPVFAALFLMVTFFQRRVPGTNGFVGEFLSVGTFKAASLWLGYPVAGVHHRHPRRGLHAVDGAAGLLRPGDRPENAGLKDLNLRESVTALGLCCWCS